MCGFSYNFNVLSFTRFSILHWCSCFMSAVCKKQHDIWVQLSKTTINSHYLNVKLLPACLKVMLPSLGSLTFSSPCSQCYEWEQLWPALTYAGGDPPTMLGSPSKNCTLFYHHDTLDLNGNEGAVLCCVIHNIFPSGFQGLENIHRLFRSENI